MLEQFKKGVEYFKSPFANTIVSGFNVRAAERGAPPPPPPPPPPSTSRLQRGTPAARRSIDSKLQPRAARALEKEENRQRPLVALSCLSLEAIRNNAAVNNRPKISECASKADECKPRDGRRAQCCERRPSHYAPISRLDLSSAAAANSRHSGSPPTKLCAAAFPTIAAAAATVAAAQTKSTTDAQQGARARTRGHGRVARQFIDYANVNLAPFFRGRRIHITCGHLDGAAANTRRSERRTLAAAAALG